MPPSVSPIITLIILAFAFNPQAHAEDKIKSQPKEETKTKNQNKAPTQEEVPLGPQASSVPPAEQAAASELESSEEPELVKAPVLTRFVEAVYPQRAIADGVESEVVLEIDIDELGQVEGVTVLRPSPVEGYGFDIAAMEASQSFEFEPALLSDGTTSPVRITYSYRFVLPEAPQPETPKVVPVKNLEGNLLERGTRLPVAAALVTVFRGVGDKAQGFETTTDAQGHFEFYDLVPGEWKILADPGGYYPLRTLEQLKADSLTKVTYYIERSSYNPFDVLVEAKRVRKEVSRTSLAIQEIEKIPGTFGDVLAVVQNLPSVARLQGGGQVVVRGSAPEDTLTFVDGIQVPSLYHFGGLKSVIPAGMLKGIDFYPGNFSVQYGRATGGILDVEVKELKPESLDGYADVSLLDAGAYLELPINKDLSIAVAARRSYVDAIISAAIPDDATLNFVTAPRYYDYQLLVNYNPTPAHRVSAFIFGSDDNTALLLEDSELGNLDISTRFYRSIFQYQYVPNETLKNEFKLSAGRNWLYFGGGQNLVFDLNIYLAQIRDTLSWTFSKWGKLTTGVDFLYYKNDAYISLPPPPKEGEPDRNFDINNTRTVEVQDDVSSSAAWFAETELTVLDDLLIIPGIRFDYFNRLEEIVFSPRIALRYKVHGMLTLKAGAGYFTQEPSFEESGDVFGNPNLSLEKALHYSAGFEYRPLSHISIDITGFYKNLDDLVGRSTKVENGTPLNYDNNALGRVYGLELLARHEFANNFFGWVAYTLAKAERLDDGANDYRFFDFDQTHILTLVASYRLPRNWEIGIRWRLVSGNPFTPVEDSIFDSDFDRFDPIPGAVNSSRLPAFHQLDVRIDKRWIYQSWMLNAYLDIQNIYNRANAEGPNYNFDYSDSQYRQGLPIATILGLRAEF
jgi:TonB family protein